MRPIGLVLAISLAAAPFPGEAQRAKIPRIGVLDGNSADNPSSSFWKRPSAVATCRSFVLPLARLHPGLSRWRSRASRLR